MSSMTHVLGPQWAALGSPPTHGDQAPPARLLSAMRGGQMLSGRGDERPRMQNSHASSSCRGAERSRAARLQSLHAQDRGADSPRGVPA